MTILVTGAAGGIGRAVYDGLARRGSAIVGQDLVPSWNIPPVLVGDLCRQRFLDQLAGELQRGDGLTAVVAAHGIAGAGRLDAIGRESASRIMAINFESVVNLWERVRPQLEDNGGAFIVIVSQAGLVGEAGNAIYCASKFALSGWLRGLSGQTPVRLRAINPGGIRTPLLEGALHDMAKAQGISYEELTRRRYGHSPAGRIGEPHEIGSLVDMALDLQAPALVEMAITGGEVLW